MFVLRVNCEDRRGIVAAVSSSLSNAQCNIEESSQFNDHLSGHFFMRVVFSPLTPEAQEKFCAAFEVVARNFKMEWDVHDCTSPIKTLLMVSKEDHCLHDILYRWRSGNLPIEITGVVSNHEICRKLTEDHGIPFHYLPVRTDTKLTQEGVLRGIIEQTNTELVVMARYMQILSEGFCADFMGRIINIHHSFLPGFKGAKPYNQAYERGVKLIGATAHFATPNLDEGPIIEQETVRVTHAHDPEKMRIMGRDTEKMVLARAIATYAQRRIFVQGHRTVIL